MTRPRKYLLFPMLCLLVLFGFSSLSCKLLGAGSTPAVQPTDSGKSPGLPKGKYLGQDGGDFAGKQCASGPEPDNIHIRLSGLRETQPPAQYRIEDGLGGVWANPCEPASNWMVVTTSKKAGEIDLYFKPYKAVPAGTRYLIMIRYSDEVLLPVVVESTAPVKILAP